MQKRIVAACTANRDLGRPLIGTGFCGAFTTFSTMQLELLKMIDHHRYGLAVGYALGTLAAGYLAIFLSTSAVRRVRLRG